MEITKREKSFLTGLVWLTLAVSVVSVCLTKSVTMWWPLLVLFFAAVSVVTFHISERARAKNAHKFYNSYMAMTVVKLVAYLTILLVYSLNFKEDSRRFMLTFLVYYVIYSFFETYQLVKKKKNE